MNLYTKQKQTHRHRSMDGPRDDHIEWSKPDRERQIPYDITYMRNLKYDTNELNYTTEIDSQTQETNLWLPKGKWGGIN